MKVKKRNIFMNSTAVDLYIIYSKYDYTIAFFCLIYYESYLILLSVISTQETIDHWIQTALCN